MTLPAGTPAAAELYIWAYPLVSVHRTRKLFCSRANTGVINHVENLATPADKGVVAPNNDTLYSSGFYDLSHGDLNIEVPPMDHPGRYWNVMILDAYTNVAYVCRRHHGVSGTKVRVTYDPTTEPQNKRSDVVTLGTPTAWVILRVLVDSPEDLEQARRLQHEITVLAPEHHPQERTERGGRPTQIAQSGAAVFTEIKYYVEKDAPALWHPKLSDEAQAILEAPESCSEEDLTAGIEAAEALMANPSVRDSIVNGGWSSGKNAEGFGDDILKRAVGAKFGLGGHQAIENRSYIAQSDGLGGPLNGDQPLQLRMSAEQLPPCEGFWSLTAYGTDLYLTENEIDRWSIGDRTPGLTFAPDGSLDITLSAARPGDISNWLPVPSGRYLLGLRVYEGDKRVVDCEWFPPALQPTEI